MYYLSQEEKTYRNWRDVRRDLPIRYSTSFKEYERMDAIQLYLWRKAIVRGMIILDDVIENGIDYR